MERPIDPAHRLFSIHSSTRFLEDQEPYLLGSAPISNRLAYRSGVRENAKGGGVGGQAGDVPPTVHKDLRSLTR
jgi:hypothetical protein